MLGHNGIAVEGSTTQHTSLDALKKKLTRKEIKYLSDSFVTSVVRSPSICGNLSMLKGGYIK